MPITEKRGEKCPCFRRQIQLRQEPVFSWTLLVDNITHIFPTPVPVPRPHACVDLENVHGVSSSRPPLSQWPFGKERWTPVVTVGSAQRQKEQDWLRGPEPSVQASPWRGGAAEKESWPMRAEVVAMARGSHRAPIRRGGQARGGGEGGSQALRGRLSHW